MHIIILYSSTFYKKGHVIRRNLNIPNARVSRFVDMCRNDARIFLLGVLSIKRVRSCNWLTEAVYKQLWCISSIFLCSKMFIKDLASVICSIDYWLLYVNRKFSPKTPMTDMVLVDYIGIFFTFPNTFDRWLYILVFKCISFP